MKKILLLGDSIRLGYQQFVKESFDGLAEVYFPNVNCAFAQNMLRWINVWKNDCDLSDDIDLVHFNVGLWDVLRIYDDGTLTSPEYYGELLPRIYKRLKILFPKAKIVFALSTNVDEAGYVRTPPYQRYNCDIVKFNEIAKKAFSALDVTINDLYSITKDLPADSECRSDMTHFNTPAGIKLIGTQVVNVICDVLDIEKDSVNKIDGKVQEISKEILGN